MVVDFMVIEVIRQQLRLREFFAHLMTEAVTEARSSAEEPPEFHDHAGRATVPLMSWDMFSGFGSLCEVEAGREEPGEGELMEILTAYFESVEHADDDDHDEGSANDNEDEEGGEGEDDEE